MRLVESCSSVYSNLLQPFCSHGKLIFRVSAQDVQSSCNTSPRYYFETMPVLDGRVFCGEVSNQASPVESQSHDTTLNNQPLVWRTQGFLTVLRTLDQTPNKHTQNQFSNEPKGLCTTNPRPRMKSSRQEEFKYFHYRLVKSFFSLLFLKICGKRVPTNFQQKESNSPVTRSNDEDSGPSEVPRLVCWEIDFQSVSCPKRTLALYFAVAPRTTFSLHFLCLCKKCS